jgi:glycylpeptide N-tetradecanoyltransferase
VLQLVRYLQQQALAKQQARYIRMAMKGKDTEKEHKFWNTQPVLQLKEEIDQQENSAIDTKTKLEDIRKEPLNMPAGFEWKEFDIMDPTEVYWIARACITAGRCDSEIS